MKTVSTLTAVFVLTACIVPTILVAADQYAVDDQYAGSYAVGDDQYAGSYAAGNDQYSESYAAGNDQYSESYAAGDDQYAGDDNVVDNSNDDGSNIYGGFTVCDNTAIEVSDVQMYCDSPGTFYYGSGKYRNSQNCTAGDKGKYVVDFYINDAATIEATGGYPVIDVSATGSIGWYQYSQKVSENVDLCSLSSLKSLSGSVCPAKGKYRIKSNFFWGEDDSYNGAFNPTLTIGFKSSIYENTYDYGGANTPYCSGTTFFTSWRNGAKKVYADSVEVFIKTFGILAFTIAVMVSFIWLMVNKPISFKDAGSKMGFRNRDRLPTHDRSPFDDDSSYANSEDFDFDKMKSGRANQSFLDF
jgi:hypothetical protein